MPIHFINVFSYLHIGLLQFIWNNKGLKVHLYCQCFQAILGSPLACAMIQTSMLPFSLLDTLCFNKLFHQNLIIGAFVFYAIQFAVICVLYINCSLVLGYQYYFRNQSDSFEELYKVWKYFFVFITIVPSFIFTQTHTIDSFNFCQPISSTKHWPTLCN